MLKVQVTPKKVMYVSFCDDTMPNKGGFYCQVYYDEEMECEYDNFVIHNYELRGIVGHDERLKKAYCIANSEVKNMVK